MVLLSEAPLGAEDTDAPDDDACHGEDCCKKFDPVEAAAKTTAASGRKTAKEIDS